MLPNYVEEQALAANKPVCVTPNPANVSWWRVGSAIVDSAAPRCSSLSARQAARCRRAIIILPSQPFLLLWRRGRLPSTSNVNSPESPDDGVQHRNGHQVERTIDPEDVEAEVFDWVLTHLEPR
ncbi:hypothetical protein HPB51_009105 [Rhipicephalus microplus]|uniref:Uncharacterized protein n=1 Tax=Rhipicephalus microplus TaxID=6941 RepID=A0A9J6F013_RHIMP|nr:hypothetical protein HPB51_009105 [Rhipicephalus microplus]